MTYESEREEVAIKLRTAIEKGHIEAATNIIERHSTLFEKAKAIKSIWNADSESTLKYIVNSQPKSKYSAFQLAVKGRHESIVRLITTKKLADYTQKCPGDKPGSENELIEMSILELAASSDHDGIFKCIYESKQDEWEPSWISKACDIAIRKNHVKIAKYIMLKNKEQANPESKNEFEDSPLHGAIKHGHTDMAELLAKYNTQHINQALAFAIHCAVSSESSYSQSHINTITCLVISFNAKIDNNAETIKSLETILSNAIKQKHSETVALILTYELYDLNDSGANKHTLLCGAAMTGELNLIQQLVNDKNIDLLLFDKPLLAYAMLYDYPDVFEFLLEHGASSTIKFTLQQGDNHTTDEFWDKQIRDDDTNETISFVRKQLSRKTTLLHYAAIIPHGIKYAQLLLKHNARLDATDEAGKDPKQYAVDAKNASMIKFFQNLDQHTVLIDVQIASESEVDRATTESTEQKEILTSLATTTSPLENQPNHSKVEKPKLTHHEERIQVRNTLREAAQQGDLTTFEAIITQYSTITKKFWDSLEKKKNDKSFLEFSINSVFYETGAKGYSAFQLAIKAGHESIVKLVITKELANYTQQCLPDEKSSEDEGSELSVLEFAASTGHCGIFELIYNDKKDGWGDTHVNQSFTAAVKHDRIEIVAYIISQSPVHQKTVLGKEIQAGTDEAQTCANIVTLLKSGDAADDESKSEFSQSPFYRALDNGNLDLIKFLAKYNKHYIDKALLHVVEKLSYSSYSDKYKYYPYLDMIKYLVEECGANIEAQDKTGKTPLYYALQGALSRGFPYFEITEYLFSQGALITKYIYVLLRPSYYNRYDYLKLYEIAERDNLIKTKEIFEQQVHEIKIIADLASAGKNCSTVQLKQHLDTASQRLKDLSKRQWKADDNIRFKTPHELSLNADFEILKFIIKNFYKKIK